MNTNFWPKNLLCYCPLNLANQGFLSKVSWTIAFYFIQGINLVIINSVSVNFDAYKHCSFKKMFPINFVTYKLFIYIYLLNTYLLIQNVVTYKLCYCAIHLASFHLASFFEHAMPYFLTLF
jgi:hypothetical protein